MRFTLPSSVLRFTAALLATIAVPTVASACGGFFCDANQPVTQAAERILFAPGDEPGMLQMHVQIVYGGPPSEFGWLLPAPADVVTSLSNPAIFARLDQAFGPQFQLTIENDCSGDGLANGDASSGAGGAGGEGGAGGGGGPDVQVLSREAVGPYDRVILQAEAASELTRWLDENDYSAPDNADALLQPYLDNGSVFVALKLLPGAGIADIAPLRLDFTADQPTVPIIPTQVAAEPDMGLIVHVVGDARAIPTNYLHVEINERAIDWFGFGANYADVVSQAADEANGQAFATDFAGPINAGHRAQLAIDLISGANLTAIRGAETLEEFTRQLGTIEEDMIVALSAIIEPVEGATVREMLTASWNYAEHPINGEAIADAIENDINPARAAINALFEGERYMSRLYTTLSAAEMTLDPLFAQNGDLEPVDNIRTATFRDQGCFTGDGQMIFSDGSRMAVFGNAQAGLIQRQAGATIRGVETRAAALVERMMPAGQPELIRGMEPGTSAQTNPPVPVPPRGDDDDSGCGGCTIDGDAPMAPMFLLGLGLLLLRRRR